MDEPNPSLAPIPGEAVTAPEFFAACAGRSDLDAFDEIMRRPGGAEPPPEDRL